MKNQVSFDPENTPASVEVNFQELFWAYIGRWPWFVGGLILSFFLCHNYLKRTPKLYESSATILVKNAAGSKLPEELIAFRDIGVMGSSNSLENEIEILKSRALMMRVVDDLSLYYECIIDLDPINLPLYNATPIKVHFYSSNVNGPVSAGDFYYQKKNKDEFILTQGNTSKKYRYGQRIDLGFGPFHISSVDGENKYADQKIHVFVYPTKIIAAGYASQLKIEPINSKSSVLRISMRDQVVARATDIINSLLRQYKIDCLEDKNLSGRATAAFINDRIRYITEELSDVEVKVKDFKTEQGLTDIPFETGLQLQSESEIEKLIVEANVQLSLAKFVNEYLSGIKSSEEFLPVNLGLEDNFINNVIENYNNLIAQTKRLAQNSTPENPLLLQYNDQILSLRSTIKEALTNLIATNQLKLSELKRQEKQIAGKISTVPGIEKEFREIQRQQQIKETLYLYLLEKREENAIASAINVSNAKTIDEAFSYGAIVSPQKSLIYIMGFFAGLIVPLILINVLTLLNDKITDKKDLEQLKIPFLGYIPTYRGKEKLAIKMNETSSFAEALRSVRTNLSFFLPEDKKCKSIFITSSIAGEGKTFLSINLAAIFATSGKKVALIALDLRKKRILEYLKQDVEKGMSNLLVSNSITLDECLVKIPGFDSLDFLPPGPMPPNPAELLMLPRLNEIFSILREKYDVLIVDTPPVGVVSDTLIISAEADAVVYLLRTGYSKKSSLRIPSELQNAKKLPNLSLLLNDINIVKSYRDYQYGYGYTEKPKSRWKYLIPFS